METKGLTATAQEEQPETTQAVDAGNPTSNPQSEPQETAEEPAPEEKPKAARKPQAKKAEEPEKEQAGEKEVKKPASKAKSVKAKEAEAEDAVVAEEKAEKKAPAKKKAATKKADASAAVEEVETAAEQSVAIETEIKVLAEEAAPETEAKAGQDAALETEIAVPAEETPEREEEEEDSARDKKDDENIFADKDRGELVDILADIVNNRPIQHQRKSVDAIKILFYKALKTETDGVREAFLNAGGKEEDFQPEQDILEMRLKELLNEYRRKRDDYISTIEKQKEDNYKTKLAIIDELKELTSNNETMHNTFAAFRDLQTRWKDAGLVPQEKLKDLWDTYNHHVENFYNYIKINKELRDLDLKRNYEVKIVLCEEAEALILDPSATNAFHKLQKLHEQWREIGPVNQEVKEQLWERFKEASTRINKRHQEYYDLIKEEQKKNLSLKEELCSKIEELAAQPFTSRKEWDDASQQVAEIQKVWKTIGFAPRKDNTRIYSRFRKACDKFFAIKREYFNQIKSEMDDNLQQKIDLCVQAEALSESDDWKTTAEAIIELQKKWKETGPTSRKHADAVWKRFRGACDKFFERKSAHFNEADSKFNENLRLKQELLAELRATLEDQGSLTFDKVKEYQRQWSEIGFVPIKQKDGIHKQYKQVMDDIFGALRGNEKDRKIDNFRSRISNMKEGGSRKINQERERLYNRVRQIESDIQVWENNVGFFAKSKNADALTGEVYRKIEKAKAEMEELIEKVKLIDQQSQGRE